MRKPLPPIQAFAEDARSAYERASDATDELVTWLSVAQSADLLTVLRGAERDAAVSKALQMLQPYATSRPSLSHDVFPLATDEVGQVAEQFRVAAEAMEIAGCFELAYTTVSAVCRLTSDGDYGSRAMATVHLGRIARQMNDSETAEDCYARTLSIGVRERDGPVAARGHIGLALLHDMRGNLPEAEAGYLRALKLAPPLSPVLVSACQGLMTLAILSDRLADALLYGWKLYDATENDFDARTSALSDLSVVALRAGFPDAAMAGFEQALTMSQVPRIRLVALGGAIRASAKLADVARMGALDLEISREVARANQSHVATMVLLYAAEAWAVAGELPRAEERLAEGKALAARFGYHEYEFQAERLDAEFASARRSQLPVNRFLLASCLSVASTSTGVKRGISRLQALAV